MGGEWEGGKGLGGREGGREGGRDGRTDGLGERKGASRREGRSLRDGGRNRTRREGMREGGQVPFNAYGNEWIATTGYLWISLLPPTVHAGKRDGNEWVLSLSPFKSIDEIHFF
jgi:hypothetical protein